MKTSMLLDKVIQVQDVYLEPPVWWKGVYFIWFASALELDIHSARMGADGDVEGESTEKGGLRQVPWLLSR